MLRLQLLLLLLLTALAASRGLALAAPRAPRQPLTCGDLASNSTMQLSYEGSWSYLDFDPNASFHMGSLGFTTYSDRDPRIPLFPNTLRIGRGDCGAAQYTWRPDGTLQVGNCGPIAVRLAVAYQSNATVCGRYTLDNGGPAAKVRFAGSAPAGQPQMNASLQRGPGGSAVVSISAFSVYGDDGARLSIDRHWQLYTDRRDATLSTAGGEYAWDVPLAGGASNESVVFCMKESEAAPPATPPPAAVYNRSATTASIDGWLRELRPLPATAAASPTVLRQYWGSWFRFWFNTEHDAGNWLRPVVTPSMSGYARGMWLWDTGFHVMALLTGGQGPRSLAKARDQLYVMTHIGLEVGHIPRVIGPSGLEKVTQPPGILTWAALVVYNRTGDADFLATAYRAFAMNNDWFYAQRADSTGLCQWMGTDSGWDTSPRWDKGVVDAVDLNAWLHLDQLMLSRMASALGRPASEVARWKAKAAATAAAVQEHLWDPSAGVFWDRLPPGNGSSRTPGPFVKVVTPASFWAMLGGIATTDQGTSMMRALLTADNLLTPHPLPCVGRSEPSFRPDNYWRGPTWINVNWLSLLGMECYGHTAMADSLRNATVALIGMWPLPREYYDPVSGEGLGALNFMWTGAVDIIVIQELAGRTPVRDILHSVVGCDALRA